MGLLFSTRGTRRIVFALNKAFNRKNLQKIRNDEQSGRPKRPWLTVQTNDWKLWKLAVLYQLYPRDPDTGNIDNGDKKRWHFFLRNTVRPQEHDIVRNALRDAIADPRFYRIAFDHVHIGSGAVADAVIFDKTVGNRILRHITLFTPKVGNANAVDFPPLDPMDPDVEPYPDEEDDGIE